MKMTAIRNIARAARRRLRDEPELRAAAMRADAFLVSYPKSGRTWLRYLLSWYFAEAAELGFQPDLTTTFRVLPNFDRDPVRGINAFAGNVADPRLPVIYVSHLPFQQRLFLDRPVVFLIRDPRDVIVSAYFHATRHKNRFAGDIAAFLDEQTYGLPALVRYLNGWGNGLANRPHHLISYEHMLAEPVAAVGGLLRFLGVEVSPQILVRAIAAAQFDRMQVEERGTGIPGHDYDRNDDQSLRMRSGKAKAFGQWLTPEQAEEVIDRLRAQLNPQAKALIAITGVDLGLAPARPLSPPQSVMSSASAARNY